MNIPPLEIIQKKLTEIKRQQQNKKPEEIEFDIPSLPSLKEIVLIPGEQAEKDKAPRQDNIMVAPAVLPEDMGRTAEELIVTDDSKTESLEALDEIVSWADAVDLPQFEDSNSSELLGREAEPLSPKLTEPETASKPGLEEIETRLASPEAKTFPEVSEPSTLEIEQRLAEDVHPVADEFEASANEEIEEIEEVDATNDVEIGEVEEIEEVQADTVDITNNTEDSPVDAAATAMVTPAAAMPEKEEIAVPLLPEIQEIKIPSPPQEPTAQIAAGETFQDQVDQLEEIPELSPDQDIEPFNDFGGDLEGGIGIEEALLAEEEQNNTNEENFSEAMEAEMVEELDDMNDQEDNIAATLSSEAVPGNNIDSITNFNSQIMITAGASGIMEAVPISENRIKVVEEVKEVLKTQDLDNLFNEIVVDGGEMVRQAYEAIQAMKLDEALQYLSTCINNGEDVGMAYYLRGFVYIKKHAWELASEELENAREFGYAAVEVQTCLNQLFFHLANHYRNVGAYREALNQLDRIITRDVSMEKGKIYWARAKAMIRYGAYEEALHDIEEAILNHYLKPEIFEARAAIYMQQHDYESALHDFTAAINRGAKSLTIFQGRSESNLALANLDAALEDVHKAQQLSPNNSHLFDLEGLILNAQKDYSAADYAFEQALGNDPGNWLHYFNRSLAYIQRGRHDRAVEDLCKVIQACPEDRISYLKRAICYQEKANPNLAQAREDFKKAEALEQTCFYRTVRPNPLRKES